MIKQFVTEDICLKCRGCCRFSQAATVWLPCVLNTEIVSLNKSKFASFQISQHKKIIPSFSKKEDTFFCPLLNIEENKCRIYARRFFDCRLYPFVINRDAGKVYLSVDLNCSFADGNFKTSAFDKYADYLLKLLESASYQEILTNNPQIVQAYPGVTDIAQLKMMTRDVSASAS